MRDCSGSCVVFSRYTEDENLVAKGEAVDGSGLRRTGDVDGEAEERARDLMIDKDLIPGELFFPGCCTCWELAVVTGDAMEAR